MQKYITVFVIFLFALSCNNEPQKPEQVATETPTAETTPRKKQKTVLFFGNSLTAGYGLEEDQSFPSLVQDRIDSLGMEYTVVNAGLSGETTAGGLNRVDWILKQDIDIFVLELGGNDMLRGIDINTTEANLNGILKKVKAKNPDIKIIVAGMLAPPNMGADYSREFGGIYPRLAKEFGAALIPFFLDKVGGIPELNLQDGIHPNAEGQKIVRENVWRVLKEYL